MSHGWSSTSLRVIAHSVMTFSASIAGFDKTVAVFLDTATAEWFRRVIFMPPAHIISGVHLTAHRHLGTLPRCGGSSPVKTDKLHVQHQRRRLFCPRRSRTQTDVSKQTGIFGPETPFWPLWMQRSIGVASVTGHAAGRRVR